MTDQIHKAFAAVYGRVPEVVAFAPGRIEFIGNHTDYNGGPVLGAAIDRGVWVALAPRNDGLRRLASDYDGGGMRVVEIPVDAFAKQGGPAAWTNYPIGVLSVLPSFGFRQPSGFDYLALSDLPSGAGLSSSAAIELASALGFLALTGQVCSPDILAQIGRKAENDFVGVPCGILDQGVSAHGLEGHLVHIDCRQMVFTRVPLPEGLQFWLFNTHSKHALVDGMYAERHRECMQAATQIGVPQLADATPAQLEEKYWLMPGTVSSRARHVIMEIIRVRETVESLASGRIDRVGEILTASHRSSQHLFDNSTPELDYLVDKLVGIPGVYGARLTGGGFGGAVLALASATFTSNEADLVARLYSQRFGHGLEVMKLRASGGAAVLAR